MERPGVTYPTTRTSLEQNTSLSPVSGPGAISAHLCFIYRHSWTVAMADVKELAARAPAQYKADNLCVVRLCVGVGTLGSRICSAFSDSERFCIPVLQLLHNTQNTDLNQNCIYPPFHKETHNLHANNLSETTHFHISNNKCLPMTKRTAVLFCKYYSKHSE